MPESAYEEEEYYLNAPAEELKQHSVPYINANSDAGLTDNVSNLVDSAAYIFSGTLDTVTPSNLQEAVESVYVDLGLNSDKVELEYADVAHRIRPNSGEIVEWLYLKLGFETELNEQVENRDVYTYGTTHTF